MKSRFTRFVSELVLWNVANVVCMVLPAAVTYYIGTNVLEWSTITGAARLSFLVTLALLVSVTWGSWAGLVWTRNRAIRVGMRAMTLFPGAMMMVGGGIGLWVGFGAWYIWGGLLAAGAGMGVVSTALSRYFRPASREPKLSSYLLGLALYPTVATAISLAIGAAWYNFVTNPASGDWREMFSIATLYTSVLAAALTTTIIPAVLSSTFRRVSLDILPR